MKLGRCSPRRLAITYSHADLAATSLIAAVVAAWVSIAAGAFSLWLLVACEAAFLAFYVTGSLVASVRAVAARVDFGLPLRLLVGYGFINSALLALAWLSPLGIIANFCALLALALGAFFAVGQHKRVASDSTGLCLVALGLLATSLWCQDSIQPRVEQGDFVLFKPWADGFYHAVHVRIFAASHGAHSIEDWRLVGVAARPYHYGMYLLPALLKQASGIDSYSVFAGALGPIGVFFTGLGAYALFGSWWGRWPGFAAAATLLLLPDGAQQGIQNTFMSYHWLTQISPSASYGLALLAVAWLFVIQGCRRGSWPQVLVGWSFAALVVAYKLHFVVASALLLLLVPALFFRRRRLGPGKRALWVAGACAVYGLGLVAGQHVPGVPLIRFDGSSVGEILRLIHTFAKPGAIRDFVVQHSGAKFSALSNLLCGIPYVLCAIFGLLVPLLVFLAVWLRRRTPSVYLLFPWLLIGNFLLMFFGLALDFASSTPDELSHRPLMIVYFFVAAWVGGALGLLLVRSRRLSRLAGPAIIGLALVLLAFPARLGAGVQGLWAMPRMSPVRVPVSLLNVADYLRDNGAAEDVFQDSQFDRMYALAALSERRTFVAHTLTRVPFRSDLIETRTSAIDRFMGIRQARAVHATARAFGFRWFVLQRGDRVAWPAEIADKPVLEAGPFRLYKL